MLPPLEPLPADPPLWTAAALRHLPDAVLQPAPRSPRRTTGELLQALGHEAMAWARTLLSAAVYATVIVTFIAQVARVEGASMQPTLENDDRLIVNKLAYVLGDPEPGDVVMLYFPLDPDKHYVKRVIAGPGDIVEIRDGRVFVNAQRVPDTYIPPGLRGHEDHGPERVREGHFYVLGDHRVNSSDSRDWGLVPRRYITGKVQVRWWPLDHARIF